MTHFREDKPIFQQIAERIEENIIKGIIKEGDQIPSTNQYASFFRINPATVAKGVNLLVEKEILYKKRGIGMFVAKGARKKLLLQRKKLFFKQYVQPLLQEAENINLTKEEVVRLIIEGKDDV